MTYRYALQLVLLYLTWPVLVGAVLLCGPRRGAKWWTDDFVMQGPCKLFGHGREMPYFTHIRVCGDCIEDIYPPLRPSVLPEAPREALHTESEYR